MGNVIDLNRGARRGSSEAQKSESSAANHARDALRATGIGALRATRYIVFLILLWLRLPIRFVLMLIAVPALIGLPIMWLGLTGPHKGGLMATVAGVSFAAFVLTWLYDTLLLRLSPEPIVLR
jgi:hypothetical protein